MNPAPRAINPLFPKGVTTAILSLCLCWILSCATAPVTGRSQLLLINEGQEIALGIKSYQEILQKTELSRDQRIIDMVTRVGNKVAAAANRPDYEWEFKVIDDKDTANAFALPGGKVAVYTGLLPYTQNEAGLAFVLAHEVAHAIARHGGERISQQLLIGLGQEGLNLAIGSQSPVAIQAINQAYGVASAVGITLPFSRRQEYEADHIGLILMAQSGYDPREAPKFFERMMSEKKDAGPPAFLSTHPADAQRIQTIYKLIPEALGYYRN
ncbi:MAG: M48 family metallopeptidase [Desulfobacterales bacterium]|nr:M48 family metallopeptidase [Desulfobacterales bacterium]MDD4072473.1 M48 family metallopeptidase [Desulfobacterales bacterium]MDD4392558.1 M48 family metallopeptidase [Desulfobacterales bacterium]